MPYIELSTAQLAVYTALIARGVKVERNDIFNINIQIPSNIFIQGSVFIPGNNGTADAIAVPHT